MKCADKNSKRAGAALAVFLAAAGALSAAGPGKAGEGAASILAGYGAAEIPVPEVAEKTGRQKWWSVNIFGSGHKASTKAALKFINKAEFPDLAAAREPLLDGSNEESGHADSKMNGGRPEDLWRGKKPETKGGVLWNYEHFKFEEAYEKLGVICHLTQDQATPAHAANIEHSFNDTFEVFYGNDVKISAARDGGLLEPFAYYQAVQDETRAKLPGWTDPRTGLPYWVAAPDAPPLGQDATYGPWGHYGGRNNRDAYAAHNVIDNNQPSYVSARPEIRTQQLAVSGAATVSVLQAASKRLPPLVRDISISAGLRSGGAGTEYSIKFGVYENRSPDITYTVYVYAKDGSPLGAASRGSAVLTQRQKNGIAFGTVTAGWGGVLDGYTRLPAGEYVLEVRVTDADGNTTPDEVNADELPFNDTKTALVIAQPPGGAEQKAGTPAE